MTNAKTLLSKTENGFNTLQVSKKYVDSALKWLETWLTDNAFKDYVPQIGYLIETEKWDFLIDSFYHLIPFGTGGRIGLVGIGHNRIYTLSIKCSEHLGLQYPRKHSGKKLKKKARKYLNLHKTRKWNYLVLNLIWAINSLMLLLNAGLIMYSLFFDKMPELFYGISLALMYAQCKYSINLNGIIAKCCREDTKADNKIRMMYVSKIFKKIADRED